MLYFCLGSIYLCGNKLFFVSLLIFHYMALSLSLTYSSLPTFMQNHHLHTQHRINLPRYMVHAGSEDEDGSAVMKTCLSTDRLEMELDSSSDVLSELSFSYELAQAEVMMKGMGSNGE